ncbi:MAG: pitrilysin family protein [Steroidobacteraceae bacterium]
MRQLWFALLLFLAVVTVQARGVSMPAFERVVLPNGVTLLLMARHDLPLIAVEAIVRGGSIVDPTQRDGTASLLASLLEKGAGQRNAFEFADTVDRVGGRLETQAQREFVSISGSFLAHDQQLMVELLADMLQRPRLSGEEFEKLRARQVEFLRAAKDSDLDGLVSVYADAALLPQHPYGRPVSGSEGSLQRVTLEDVRTYYAQQFGADRLIVSVVGDFEPRALQRQLTRALGGWRRAGVALPELADPVASSPRQVLLIDAPESTHSYFWLGSLGVAKTDHRRAALDAINAVFGGRFTSLLNVELRIESGLTYGARSRFERLAHPGFWSISSYTRTQTTTAAIDKALDVLQRLHTDGLSESELASGRQYVQGQFPLALETAEDWAGMLGQIELYGLDRSYVEGYFDALDRVDVATARDAIETAFPPRERLQLVVIGPANQIREALRKYGPLQEMKLKDPEFTPGARP